MGIPYLSMNRWPPLVPFPIILCYNICAYVYRFILRFGGLVTRKASLYPGAFFFVSIPSLAF